MKYSIDYVRKLYREKEEKPILTEDDKKKMDNLRMLLKYDDIFFSLPSSTAMSILDYLGIEKENIETAYLDLISFNEYKNNNNNYYL